MEENEINQSSLNLKVHPVIVKNINNEIGMKIDSVKRDLTNKKYKILFGVIAFIIVVVAIILTAIFAGDSSLDCKADWSTCTSKCEDASSRQWI